MCEGRLLVVGLEKPLCCILPLLFNFFPHLLFPPSHPFIYSLPLLYSLFPLLSPPSLLSSLPPLFLSIFSLPSLCFSSLSPLFPPSPSFLSPPLSPPPLTFLLPSPPPLPSPLLPSPPLPSPPFPPPHQEGDQETATKMQELALAEGALPRHLHTALFTSSLDNRLLTHRSGYHRPPLYTTVRANVLYMLDSASPLHISVCASLFISAYSCIPLYTTIYTLMHDWHVCIHLCVFLM